MILYYSYLSPQRFKNTNEILHALEQKGISLSLRIYYGRRKKALEILSSVLWGYTSICLLYTSSGPGFLTKSGAAAPFVLF